MTTAFFIEVILGKSASYVGEAYQPDDFWEPGLQPENR